MAKRADAERNRDRILSVARSAFAETGGQLSMAEVARRADVGMATLYRNFPGRRELIEALYTDEVDGICAAAEATPAGAPAQTLDRWLREFAAFIASKRPLSSELLADATQTGTGAFLSGGRLRVLAAGRPLLTAAQDAGQVRADLTLEQVLDMVSAVAAIRGEPGYVRPMLDTVLAGLRG
jgi:AcrR family transcriptional regulator